MLKPYFLFCCLLCSTAVFANIPIEIKGLSQSNTTNISTPPAINTSSTAVIETNPTWDLIQKNQQLEQEVRTLRGKLEEFENELQQMKNELQNRYTDLDQRLQLLEQEPETEETPEPPAVEEKKTEQPTQTTANKKTT